MTVNNGCWEAGHVPLDTPPPFDDYRAAERLLQDFLARLGHYWPSPPSTHRQHRKLEKHLAMLSERTGSSRDEVIGHIGALGLRRSTDRPPPIYVMGLGGSGSHWLTELLAAAQLGVALPEVYVPKRLADAMEGLSDPAKGYVIDCIHLIHAGPCIGRGHLNARFVNPAAGTPKSQQQQADPECFFIHLLRDPRDQVMSVTFRKSEYRTEQSPGATDEEYLVRCATRNRTNFAMWRRSSIEPNIVCRYEELCSHPEAVLGSLTAALREEVDSERVAAVAHEHDAQVIRSKAGSWKGNLSPAKSKGWRATADHRQRAALHAHLSEVVTATGYPQDECLGSSTSFIPSIDDRLYPAGAVDDVGVLLFRSGQHDAEWTSALSRDSNYLIPAGAAAKLRVNEDTGGRDLLALLQEISAIDALCLAGNSDMDDSLLASVVGFVPTLKELDLARTKVTDDGLETLTKDTQIIAVSLLETKVSQSTAAAGLRRRSPSVDAVII